MTAFLRLYRLWLQQVCRSPWPLHTWHYTGGKRDLRLDFLRGFAICAMLINHIGGAPSWFYVLTGGSRFFVSVAECFVTIAGLLVGSIYSSIIVQQGLGPALIKCLQRAWKLYCLTVVLTVGYAGLALVLGFSWAPQLSAATWPDFLLSVMTLHRTFDMTDILLLYTLLLLAAVPALLLLAHGYTRQVLVGTWSLWALWHIAPQHAQFPWPIADNTVFYFPTWQVLFMTALVLGYHRAHLMQRLAHVSPHRVLGLSGVCVVGTLALYAWEPGSPELAQLLERVFDKANLGPGRLLAFAGFFSFALALLTLIWQPCFRVCGWLFLPLGQHALSAYTLHLLILALVLKGNTVLLGDALPTVWHNMCVQSLGVGCLWSLIRLQPVVRTHYLQGIHTLRQLAASTLLRLTRVQSLGTRTAALAVGLARLWL